VLQVKTARKAIIRKTNKNKVDIMVPVSSENWIETFGTSGRMVKASGQLNLYKFVVVEPVK
jgi:hypothetical protein